MSNEDKRINQVISSKNLSGLDVESAEYVAEFIEDVNRVEPHVDFSKPENFAKYGSAQEYYDQALKWIYNEYPYDGSLKEKIEWKNNSTLLDTYIFDNRYPKTTGYVTLTSDGYDFKPAMATMVRVDLLEDMVLQALTNTSPSRVDLTQLTIHSQA